MTKHRCGAGRYWDVFAHREEKKKKKQKTEASVLYKTWIFLKNCKAIDNKLHKRAD